MTAPALIKQAKKLPTELYKSLIWDRGKELTDHRRFTLATNIDVYFCDPQSQWQCGSNENTNGLLRQYFPKGTDLSVHSQAYLNKVARQLNERPRQTLQFETFDRMSRHPIIGRPSFRGDSITSSTRISFRYTGVHSKR
jgi:IS30 family transposase